LQSENELAIMEKTLNIKYREYASVAELGACDAELMRRAVAATEGAYAPYSGFRVGAAVRLADGSVVTGSNQENAAYPSGLCAERTAVFAASAQRPDMRDYEALAIAGRNGGGELCEASPCGACRQVMAEYESRYANTITVLCYLSGGRIRRITGVKSLLPFGFDAEL
jgi:cytidine deaminase